MRRLIILSGIIFGTVHCLHAQQPVFNQFIQDASYANAALTGNINPISATALYRAQWAGLEDAPATAMLIGTYGTGTHNFWFAYHARCFCFANK